MGLFLKRTRGSITIMVTLILIPTIFFTGFLVDLARIKLYSNQAVMTADNYGEAVLTNYDNLLKELYGLFAVSQSEEGKAALDSLDEYVKSSFAPGTSTISKKYLQAIRGTTSYSGFMPYQNAEVTLSYSAAKEANLGNTAVLSTQIGDFMKFRIAQTMGDAGDTILEAVDEVKNMESNANAINKKAELDEKAGAVVEVVMQYYKILKDIAQYPAYLRKINQAYANAKTQFNNCVNSGSYKIYTDYITNETAINNALARQKKLKKGESLTEEEQKYIDMYNAYQNDPNARTSYFSSVFESAINSFIASTDSSPVDFANFDSLVNQLKASATNVTNIFGEVQTLRSQLESMLNDPKVSDTLKTGITEELTMLDELFDANGSFSAANYTRIAQSISANSDQNKTYERNANAISLRMEEIENAYLYIRSVPSWQSELNTKDWYDFTTNASYNKLYNSLIKWFEDADDAEAKKAKQKQKEAKKALSDAEKGLKGDEETSARDIPASFNMGTSGKVKDFALTSMIKTAASYFSSSSLAQAGNKLLLQLYTVQYDFGMFSSRVTNVEKEDGEGENEKKESLTGYEMSRNINYLYQAELEYLFGGYNSSKQNLNAARNKILAFRAIVNYTATYSVDEIDTPIKAISEAAAAVNPVLGLVVSGALRLAVAGIETAGDWDELKKGEAVVLLKDEFNDLTSYDKFKGLIGGGDKEKGESSSLKLDYEQYLMVMLIFMTSPSEIATRTGNLISLNVNTVKQGIGSSGTLSTLEFKMENAVTAVDATCSVHLDFVVMPKGFAQIVVDGSTYTSLENFEKNTYKFTVTRGY